MTEPTGLTGCPLCHRRGRLVPVRSAHRPDAPVDCPVCHTHWERAAFLECLAQYENEIGHRLLYGLALRRPGEDADD